jgi:hypothetical protein
MPQLVPPLAEALKYFIYGHWGQASLLFSGNAQTIFCKDCLFKNECNENANPAVTGIVVFP